MIEVTIKPQVAVYLSEDDAKLFMAFQQNYQTVAHLLGCMDGLNLKDLKNVSVNMDIDKDGKLAHTAITRHYRNT